MPTTIDSVLGTSYIYWQDFQARAKSFGCTLAIENWLQPELEATVALASRLVDAHCSRDFAPDAITENHAFNLGTRRTQINRPPVVQLLEFKVQTAPNVYATFNLNSILVNNQEGYLEVNTLALATGLTSPVIMLGIHEPQAVFTYKSYQSIPTKVTAATGFIAAKIANEGYMSGLIAQGLQSVTDAEQSLSRVVVDTDIYEIPPFAVLLLTEFTRPVVA